jgi:hypothetical protein
MEMQIVVQAIVDVTHGGVLRPMNAISRDIIIRVKAKTLPESLWGFVKEQWQWLWTALLVPFMLWAWEKFRRRTVVTQKLSCP